MAVLPTSWFEKRSIGPEPSTQRRRTRQTRRAKQAAAMSGGAAEAPAGGVPPAAAVSAADAEALRRQREEARRKYDCNTLVGPDPPCGHNSWDNVRVIKRQVTLRCRECQLQWRTQVDSVWRRRRCSYFNTAEGCALGAACPKVHMHAKKLSREARLLIQLRPVVEDMPTDDERQSSASGPALSRELTTDLPAPTRFLEQLSTSAASTATEDDVRSTEAAAAVRESSLRTLRAFDVASAGHLSDAASLAAEDDDEDDGEMPVAVLTALSALPLH